MNAVRDICQDYVTYWDSAASTNELRPLIKKDGNRERIIADLRRLMRRGRRPAVRRSALLRPNLRSFETRTEADLAVLQDLPQDQREAPFTVVQSNDSDSFFFFNQQQARWLLLHDSKTPNMPWSFVDKTLLKGSAALPFTDRRQIQVYGLLAGHEYIDPGFGFSQLAERVDIMQSLASAFSGSRLQYDEACKDIVSNMT